MVNYKWFGKSNYDINKKKILSISQFAHRRGLNWVMHTQHQPNRVPGCARITHRVKTAERCVSRVF